jgi:hypothetical protein
VRRGWALGALLAGATVALEVNFRNAAHPLHGWHAVPALDLVYGLLGCALIVLGSKALGRAGLQKREPYYGEDE